VEQAKGNRALQQQVPSVPSSRWSTFSQRASALAQSMRQPAKNPSLRLKNGLCSGRSHSNRVRPGR